MEHRSLPTDLVVPDDNNACGNQRAGEPAPNVAQEELLEEKQVGGPVNCSASELCTFLAGLEAGFLPTYYSDTSPSVQLKSMSIASRSYRRGKKTVVFHGFPSLQMSRNLTESLGAGLLTWFLAGFPVRTSAQQDEELELTANEVGFGEKWRESFAKYNPDSCSWKTAQCSLLADSDEFSETWPRWGSMRNGACSERPMLARYTSANEYGYWPTPLASDVGDRKTKFAQGGTPLSLAVKLFPTITIHGNYNRKGLTKTSGDGLATFVKKYPTPTKRSAPDCDADRRRNTPSIEAIVNIQEGTKGGRLNPEWIEWLMGWPIGATGLSRLETVKFHEWQQQHGGCFLNDSTTKAAA